MSSPINGHISEETHVEELRDLLDIVNEVIEENEELKRPNFSFAPIWIASCIVAYVYGITMGLYMCSK